LKKPRQIFSERLRPQKRARRRNRKKEAEWEKSISDFSEEQMKMRGWSHLVPVNDGDKTVDATTGALIYEAPSLRDMKLHEDGTPVLTGAYETVDGAFPPAHQDKIDAPSL
jgi:hypothetical protein